jgi:hypothetical protein
MRLASLRSCWRNRCSITRRCEALTQKVGDVRREAQSRGASDGGPSSQSATGVGCAPSWSVSGTVSVSTWRRG